jgi:hypothetical protein
LAILIQKEEGNGGLSTLPSLAGKKVHPMESIFKGPPIPFHFHIQFYSIIKIILGQTTPKPTNQPTNQFPSIIIHSSNKPKWSIVFSTFLPSFLPAPPFSQLLTAVCKLDSCPYLHFHFDVKL